MKSPGASTCCAVLILVLGGSSCLASRPETSRMLLADPVTPAGLACTTDELCSNGDGTSTKCPGALTLCPAIPAGATCQSTDICSAGVERVEVTSAGTLCPADPATKSGTCPVISAGDGCKSKDQCAIDATKSAPCVTGRNGLGVCPLLVGAATCSALAGECSGAQECSAPLVVRDPKAMVSEWTGNLLNGQDSARGACVDEKAAGSACIAGSDVCSWYGPNTLFKFCSGTTCPLARPGQACSKANPRDKCFDDATEGGLACPTPSGVCPGLASGKKCRAGDVCATAGQACSAVGDAEGTCVAATAAGAGCTITGGVGNTPVICKAVQSDLSLGLSFTNVSTTACVATATNIAANYCPLIPAGQACFGTDKCSDGGTTLLGVPCADQTDYASDTTSGTCDSVDTDCYEKDQCTDRSEVCSGKGNIKGTCVLPVSAGDECVGAEFCAPTGAPCPALTGGSCPAAPAGAQCSPSSTPIDKCYNGVVDTDKTKTSIDCPTGASRCPSLATGLKCTVGRDLCVKGAQCIAGVCQPSSKAFASSTQPAATGKVSGTSTATKVPAVISVATLTNYDTTTFTKAKQGAEFCTTVQANILSTLNALSSCTVTDVTPGSVNVANTVAFTGSDSAAAEAAQKQLAAQLATPAGITSVYGTGYGTVTVSKIQQDSVSNPNTSGAAAVGMAWTVGVALMISALVLTI